MQARDIICNTPNELWGINHQSYPQAHPNPVKPQTN